MRARAPVADGRLGHEGDEHALLLGDLLQEDPQKGEPVGHSEHVGVVEVELELRIRPLGDHIVEVPAEPLENVDHLAEEAHRVDRELAIVAEGLAARTHALAGQGVVVEGLDRPAVHPAHGHELGLDAGVDRVAPLGCLAHRALERASRAKVIGLVLPPQIGEDPGAALVPGADDQAVEIGDRDLVGIGGAQLGHEGDRVDRELRSLAGAQQLQVAERDRLGLGHPQQVDPARQDVFHARFLEARARLGDPLRVGQRLAHGRRIITHLGLPVWSSSTELAFEQELVLEHRQAGHDLDAGDVCLVVDVGGDEPEEILV